MNGFFRRLASNAILCAACAGSVSAQAAAPAQPLPIKVVVVTIFERGEDTGDTPGDLCVWGKGTTSVVPISR